MLGDTVNFHREIFMYLQVLMCAHGLTCVRVSARLARSHTLPGWRKALSWQKQLKTLLRVCGSIHQRGGAKKRERLDKAVQAYLQHAYTLEHKVFVSLGELRAQPLSLVEQSVLVEIEYFHELLIHHLDKGWARDGSLACLGPGDRSLSVGL